MALRFARGLRVSLTLDHPNIVSCLGFHIDLDRAQAYIVSPRLSRGNIYDHLRKEPTITFEQRMKWVVDVTKGLDYLHSFTPPVVHGDLKPENILLDDADSAQLCDYGQCDLVEHYELTAGESHPSLRRCAPEILDDDTYKRTTSSDM